MARYLIGTALKKDGTHKKAQPADKFRKLLIRQKIPFTERHLHPMNDRIDLELKDPAWDEVREKGWNNLQYTYRREISDLTNHPAIEFIFDDTQTL